MGSIFSTSDITSAGLKVRRSGTLNLRSALIFVRERSADSLDTVLHIKVGFLLFATLNAARILSAPN
jgi:hypothetical protein